MLQLATREVFSEKLTLELRPEQEGIRKAMRELSIPGRGISHDKSSVVRMSIFIMK